MIYTLLYIVGGVNASSTDSVEVSLLTCAPGQEVYALYGHTAIRIRSCVNEEDWVFNYGVFSFNRPHFVWRFTRGECDYQIGALPFKYFAEEYKERGSSVYQQVLNLTGEEKKRLMELLMENMRPENREYRYNFLYDNCTTRARDRIEEAVDGIIIYPEQDTVHSYREIIHQYTVTHPWAELGNDICLGAEADRPVSVREEMFAPFYLLRYANGAKIQDQEGNERPLVLSQSEIVKGKVMEGKGENLLSPVLCAWVLFLCVAAATFAERFHHGCYWMLDAGLMVLVGGIGVVVAFLFFFSLHPTVGSNWQIWVFNPTHLFAMPWVVWCGMKRRPTSYHLLNAVVLILFMIFFFVIPQDFCVVVVPLALTLWLRSCSYLLKERKRKD